MIVYPAIDVMGGRCVRLKQGCFERPTRYRSEPAQALREYARAGAQWAHVVDLDGARAGVPRQHALLADLASKSAARLQVGGGFREAAQLRAMFDAGVARVAVGSLAVKAPEVVAGWLDAFGVDRIVLALDVNVIAGEPVVATGGWAETSGVSLWEAVGHYPRARHLLVTDIGRDGMLAGPNLALIAEAAQRTPHLQIQASGGVASLDDLRDLAQAGAAGAVVGKALWEGKFDLAEAMEVARP